MSRFWAVGRIVAAACVVVALVAAPVSAQARSAVGLNRISAKKKPASLVTFTGRAGTRAGRHVVVERQVGRTWRVIARGRTASRGKFALTWITPPHGGAIVVRARLDRARGLGPDVRRRRRWAPGRHMQGW